MIIQELAHLCERENLLESGYEQKPVNFLIELNTDGSFHNLLSTQDEKGRGTIRKIPALPKRSSGVNSGFLVDNSKYVLGIGMDAKDFADEEKSRKKRMRNAECQEAFVNLVSKAHFSREEDAELNAVSLFYKDFATNRAALLEMRAENEWSGAEMLAFTFCDVDNVVHESEGAKAFWATSINDEKASAEQIVCLATGQAGALARLHPVVKRVPNGQSSGTSLVSFNAPSFESHGAKQGACSPVSEITAERYTTALNWLLSRSPTRIYRQGVRVGPEAVTLLWTKEEAPELVSMFNLFDEEQEEKAKGSPEKGLAVFESAWKGLAPSDVDDTQLFALTIGGNASRIVIRDWFTTTLGKTKAAIRQYFEDIALSEAPVPMPMFKLLGVLDPPGRSKLEPSLSGKIFHAALTGKPFPRTMLTHALMRLRTGDKWWENETRTAIIKAYLRRQGRDIKVSLDENNTDTAYLLGRLFFVMEKLQLDAAGGSLNRSIRDSYFSSASATPGVVFGRILSLSMNHVSKLGKKANWLEKTKGEIIDHLGAEPFPKTLSPEQQGLFAVGYYHQQKNIFTKKENEETKTETNSEVKEETNG